MVSRWVHNNWRPKHKVILQSDGLLKVSRHALVGANISQSNSLLKVSCHALVAEKFASRVHQTLMKLVGANDDPKEIFRLRHRAISQVRNSLSTEESACIEAIRTHRRQKGNPPEKQQEYVFLIIKKMIIS